MRDLQNAMQGKRLQSTEDTKRPPYETPTFLRVHTCCRDNDASPHAAMADPILTAALPLRNFLDIHTFHCNIPEYQRSYQWEAKVHTDKLLEDLRYAFEQAQPVMLLGNIILQQTDCHQGHNRPGATFWWEERSRNCDIVDGQQRTTTLVMLYAAIQEHFRSLESHGNHKELIQALNTRLSGELGRGQNKGAPFLLTQQDDFEACFDFKVKGSLMSNLQRLSPRRRERKNAEYMIEWLQKAAEGWLQSTAKEGSTSPRHDVAGFLDWLDKSVYLTLTVTGQTQLAFQSFANINYSGVFSYCLLYILTFLLNLHAETQAIGRCTLPHGFCSVSTCKVPSKLSLLHGCAMLQASPWVTRIYSKLSCSSTFLGQIEKEQGRTSCETGGLLQTNYTVSKMSTKRAMPQRPGITGMV